MIVWIYFAVVTSLISLWPCRRFFQTAHFYVEESSSPRVVANENIPIIPIPGKTRVLFQYMVKKFTYLYFFRYFRSKHARVLLM